MAAHAEHPLNGIKAKMARADESLLSLKMKIEEFLGREPRPYRIVRGFETDPLKYVFRAYEVDPVPLEIPVLAGEIIHHFRSCFDHLIVQLAATTGQKMLNNHQFPICRSREQFKKAIKGGNLKGVPFAALKLIIAEQPYRHPTPNLSTINAINSLDISDKHRVLIVAAQLAKMGQEMTVGSQTQDVTINGLAPPGNHLASREGTEVFYISLGHPVADFEATVDFSSEIVVPDFSDGQILPLVLLLEKMRNHTAKTLNRFVEACF